jgi:hypothetical protein
LKLIVQLLENSEVDDIDPCCVRKNIFRINGWNILIITTNPLLASSINVWIVMSRLNDQNAWLFPLSDKPEVGRSFIAKEISIWDEKRKGEFNLYLFGEIKSYWYILSWRSILLVVQLWLISFGVNNFGKVPKGSIFSGWYSLNLLWNSWKNQVNWLKNWKQYLHHI